jgi:hypothetical protein
MEDWDALDGDNKDQPIKIEDASSSTPAPAKKKVSAPPAEDDENW